MQEGSVLHCEPFPNPQCLGCSSGPRDVSDHAVPVLQPVCEGPALLGSTILLPDRSPCKAFSNPHIQRRQGTGLDFWTSDHLLGTC